MIAGLGKNNCDSGKIISGSGKTTINSVKIMNRADIFLN